VPARPRPSTCSQYLQECLVDEEVARIGFGVRIPRGDLDALVLRFAKSGRETFTILDGDGDDVDAAGDPRLDNLVLFDGIGFRRTGKNFGKPRPGCSLTLRDGRSQMLNRPKRSEAVVRENKHILLLNNPRIVELSSENGRSWFVGS
jgi:hypothetical protein